MHVTPRGSRRTSSTQLPPVEEGTAVLTGLLLPPIAATATSAGSSRRSSRADDSSSTTAAAPAPGQAAEQANSCSFQQRSSHRQAEAELSVLQECSLSSVLSMSSSSDVGFDAGPGLMCEPSSYGMCGDNPAAAVQLHRPPLVGKLQRLRNRLSSRQISAQDEQPQVLPPPQQQVQQSLHQQQHQQLPPVDNSLPARDRLSGPAAAHARDRRSDAAAAHARDRLSDPAAAHARDRLSGLAAAAPAPPAPGRISHGEELAGAVHMVHHGRSKSSSLALQPPSAAMHVDAIPCGHHDRRHSGGCAVSSGPMVTAEKRWVRCSRCPVGALLAAEVITPHCAWWCGSNVCCACKLVCMFIV
jgi:hypothetical protein